MRLRLHRRLLIPLLLMLIPSAVFATVIITHFIPSHTAPQATMITLCNKTQLQPIDNITAFAGLGAVAFNCPSGSGALTANRAGTLTPNWPTLGGYDSLYLITPPSSSSFNCESGIHLLNNTLVNIPLGSYSYCFVYTTPGAFSALTVNWNQ